LIWLDVDAVTALERSPSLPSASSCRCPPHSARSAKRRLTRKSYLTHIPADFAWRARNLPPSVPAEAPRQLI